ncbi:ATP-binding cassette domain-containing protein [Lactobacillus sp. UBA5813]|uniref:ATP-binding cassette domain-containing protein n=1 Tax=Lactobacillus sp. UBA5813 TaxID=1946729 RepID=UPI002580B9A8|nr:ABC transporter ATP-binding protein [Lactobacillus sp. UBA5813]
MSFKTIIKHIPKVVLLGIIITTIISSFDGVVLSAVISNVTLFNRNSSVISIVIYISLGLFAWLFIYFSMSLKQILVNRFIKLMNILLKSNFIYSQVLHPRFESDESNNVSKLFNDFKLVETNYFSTIFELYASILMSVVSAAYILTLNVTVGLIFIIFSTLPLISSKLFGKVLNSASLSWQNSSSQFLSKVTDLFKGIRTIKTYLADKFMYNDTINYLNQSENSYQKMNNLQAWAMFTSAILSVVSFLFPLGVGLFFITQNQITATKIIAIFLASDRVVGPLRNAAQYINQIKTTQSIRKNLKTQLIHFNDHQQIATFEAPELKLDDVSFKYSSNKKVIDHLTVSFPFGSKSLITGNSGTGKSTLLDLIQGFIKPDSGKIYLTDGIKKIARVGESSMIAYIEQNPTLFNDTIKFNLTLGYDFSDKQCLKVLNTVGLVTELGDNILSNHYGEGGKNLSGGQKQRVEIARALLFKKKIILIDEATSALDSHMSDQIQAIINNLHSTVIEIAHHYDKAAIRGMHYTHYKLAAETLKVTHD